MAVDELKTTGYAQKYSMQIRMSDFSWRKFPTEVRNVSLFLLFEHYICLSLVVSKASLRRLPLVKRFALRNVASIIKIDNI